METWKRLIIETVRRWFGSPADFTTFAILLLVALVVLMLVMYRAVKSIQPPEASMGRAMLASLGSFLLVAVATVAVDLYLAPKLGHNPIRRWLPLLSPLAALLLLAVPFSSVVFRINFVQALVALSIALASAVVAVILTFTAVDAMQQGGVEIKKTKSRTESLNEIL